LFVVLFSVVSEAYLNLTKRRRGSCNNKWWLQQKNVSAGTKYYYPV